jgi:hypothetical protein
MRLLLWIEQTTTKNITQKLNSEKEKKNTAAKWTKNVF